MSKRSWLPTQKGTEVWPRTTVQPPKLIIEGVTTGTPLYHAAAERYGGMLKQFHGRCQQDYSLTENGQVKRHVDWGTARATYLNVQGQEILRLEVDHKELEKLGKEGAERVPDFAVIDIVVRDSADIQFEFHAALKIPSIDRTKYLDEEGNPINGIEVDNDWFPTKDYSDRADEADEKNIFLRYADPEYVDEELSGISNRVSSLLVDFRRLGPHEAVAVDIYQWSEPFEREVSDPPVYLGQTRVGYDHSGDSNTGYVIVTEHTYEVYTDTLLTPPHPSPPEQWVADDGFIADNQSDLYAHFAAMVPPDEPGTLFTDVILPANTWYDTYTGFALDTDGSLTGQDPDIVNPGRATNSGDEPYFSAGYDFYQKFRLWIVTYTTVSGSNPVFDYPTHTETIDRFPADLTFAFYEPGQQFVNALLPDHVSGLDCAIWLTHSQQPPVRSKFAETVIDPATVPDPESIDNPGGVRAFLGRVTLDRSTRSIGWKPRP